MDYSSSFVHCKYNSQPSYSINFLPSRLDRCPFMVRKWPYYWRKIARQLFKHDVHRSLWINAHKNEPICVWNVCCSPAHTRQRSRLHEELNVNRLRMDLLHLAIRFCENRINTNFRQYDLHKKCSFDSYLGIPWKIDLWSCSFVSYSLDALTITRWPNSLVQTNQVR